MANVNQSIAGALQGLDACRQVEVDRRMLELDGDAQQGGSGRQCPAGGIAGRGPGPLPRPAAEPLYPLSGWRSTPDCCPYP